MSRTARIRPTGAAVVVGAMIGAVALAGCGAGQIAQTSEQVAAVGGVNAGTGPVVVRDARIEFADGVEGGNVYERGGTAPLQMSIVNTGTQADRLVSATSPVATSVQVTGDVELPGGQVLVVDGEPAAAPSVQPTPGAGEAPATPLAPEPGAAPTSTAPTSAAPTSAAPTSAAPTSAAPTSAAPGGTASGEGEIQVVLTGLREDIRAGLTYPVVLTFERAGEIRLDVPVGNPSAPREVESGT